MAAGSRLVGRLSRTKLGALLSLCRASGGSESEVVRLEEEMVGADGAAAAAWYNACRTRA
jgi:hypothetical protein